MSHSAASGAWPDRQLLAAEQRGCPGERRSHIVRCMSRNREQLAAIVIADEGNAAPGVSHLAQRSGHAIGHTGQARLPACDPE